MPIRINLLAEAQAAEELRRRDPVKRAILAGICIVVIVLGWISTLQVKIMANNSSLGTLEAKLNSRTNQYTQILQDKQKLQDVKAKLAALNRLAANRFLQGTLLDSPMHATVDGIQLIHLRTEQNFETVPEIKAVIEEGKTTKPGQAASSTAHVKLILDARDASPYPGNEQISRFKETLAQMPYFRASHISTNNIMLKGLSSPQVDSESGKPFVVFSLECRYPDQSRL